MRITLDTNQLIRALLRPPQLATFIMAWEARRFIVIASGALLDEYDHVLAYPDIAHLVYPELVRAFRSHLRFEIELVDVPVIEPISRDPDDDKVIATAIFGQVDYLVTEDDDLRTPLIVKVLRNAGIEVISTDELLELLD